MYINLNILTLIITIILEHARFVLPLFLRKLWIISRGGGCWQKIFFSRFLTMIDLISQSTDKFRSYAWKYVRAFIVKRESFFYSVQDTNKGQQELQIRVKSRRLSLYIPFYQQKPMIMGAKNKHIHPYSQIIFFIAARLKKNIHTGFPTLELMLCLFSFTYLTYLLLILTDFKS